MGRPMTSDIVTSHLIGVYSTMHLHMSCTPIKKLVNYYMYNYVRSYMYFGNIHVLMVERND